MKKLMVLTLTLVLIAAMAVTTANAQEVHIPDANLAAVIRETLGLPAGAAITADAMRELTELNARGRGIADLTGLEHAVNLTELRLNRSWIDNEYHWNLISNVSPLASLTNLERLDLSNNAVSDISVLANLTNLTGLFLGYTAVSDISVLANLTNLERLDLGGTAVSDVSALASLTNLERLELWGTGVSDVSALAHLTNLEWLDLGGTAVSDVSALASLTNLDVLYLRRCPLNAAAHQTHIPAIQANGTEVEFNPLKPIQLPGVPSLVSLIYFRPSDRPVRPNVDAEIDALIKKAQRFFADEMERHGFGRKTFQFETDGHGNAVVHHVNGKFTEAYYRQQNGRRRDEIREQIYRPRQSITVYMLDGNLLSSAGLGGGSPYDYGGADIDSWSWGTIAHELGHAFGMPYHDFRDDRYLMSYGSDEELSPCFAAWLDVHPAFNPAVVRRHTSATIQMLPATLAAPPNAIRLRFTVTAPAGSLYQARLLIPDEKTIVDGYDWNSGGLIGCKRIDGNPTRSTVEFVTALAPDTESVSLHIIGIDGDEVGYELFPIDVASLLPPAKVVSIPDLNLAAAVREALNMSAGETFTTRSILNLVELDARNRGIKSLTGLEHAVNLKEVDLGGEYISGEGSVNSNAISDFSPLEKLTALDLILYRTYGLRDVSALANLTNLEGLDLTSTGVSDVSALARLTNLKWLSLNGTNVSDVSALANLTNLEGLNLGGTGVSDVSALAHLTNLESLNLGGTGVSDVSALANLTNLEWLDLGGTGVSDVSALASLTNLKVLVLTGTAVSDVSALASLTNLKWLHLDGTGVSDVSALARLTNLESLVLRYTDVSDVSPLLGVILTGSVYLRGCPLSYASIHTHIPALQAKGIEVEFDNVADVNGDGVVNVQDLVLVAGQFGKTGEHVADVNGDGVVNIQDLVLVAGAFGAGAAAPSVRAVSRARLTVSDVEEWLIEASRPGGLSYGEDSGSGDPELQSGNASRPGGLSYGRGIAVLERLLASLMPKETVLLANYPNPFNPETWIPYQLSEPAEVTVTIYAANGAVVRRLDLGHRRAGSYDSRGRAAYWDGRNAAGESVASGVYFYTLSAGDFSATRKMVIRK